MLKSFKQIKAMVHEKEPKKMAVVFPHDLEVIEAVTKAYHLHIVNPVLIGDKTKIMMLIKNEPLTIIDETDEVKACKIAMDLVNDGKIDIIMKGLIDTKVLLKAVVNTTYGIKKEHLLSHVGLVEYPHYDRLLFVTDGAMNITPDVSQKIEIIENAVKFVHKLGIDKPKVGLVSAVEKVNPKMQSTVDAKMIVDHYKDRELKFDIDGPFAIDNLVSLEASKHKGIHSSVAGLADILVFPNIESGNVFYKTSVFLANAASAGTVLGAKVPIVLTSRADDKEAKLNSIYLAVVV